MMPTQTVTIQLPESLYQQVKQRAQQRQRSVEDELLSVVAEALPVIDDLPLDIANDMAQLTFLTNDELWQAAYTTLDANQSERMQVLISKQQREGLTPEEDEEARRLVHLYDRTMLIRAQAAVLLKERGQDISSLKQPLPSNE